MSPSVAQSMASDYLAWDNVEAVTHESARRPPVFVDPDPSLRKGTSANPPGAFPPVNPNTLDTVPWAKRRALTFKELAASGGVYTAQDLVWIYPQAVLTPGLVPKMGDVVVDANGFRYTVLEVTLGKLGNTWRLTTRDLVLANDLQDRITIERAALTFDAAGAYVKHFPTDASASGGENLFANLPARVQEQKREIVDERGIRGFLVTYDVIVSRQIFGVSNEDRILWGSVYLDIRGYRNATRITELPVIEAVKRP